MAKQEHQKEIERLKAEVSKGNVSVARQLGALIYGGVSGKETNYSAAKQYLFMSATKANDERAQHFLAKLYEKGKVVKQDLSWAIMWYYCAAYQGHAKAQYDLGRVLGNNGHKDNYEWLHWICCAALSGEETACGYLQEFNGYGFLEKLKLQSTSKKLTASIRDNGIIPEANGIKSHFDPNKGRSNAILKRDIGNSSEKSYYNDICEVCDVIIRNRAKHDNEYKNKVARLKQEVDNGDISKAEELGRLILEGPDKQQFNWSEALKYLEIAALDAKDAGCQYLLGMNAEKGGDIEYATALYRGAAEQHHPLASYALGRLLYETGNPDDESEWLFWIVVSYVQGVRDDAARFIETLDEDTRAIIPDVEKVVREAGY